MIFVKLALHVIQLHSCSQIHIFSDVPQQLFSFGNNLNIVAQMRDTFLSMAMRLPCEQDLMCP